MEQRCSPTDRHTGSHLRDPSTFPDVDLRHGWSDLYWAGRTIRHRRLCISPVDQGSWLVVLAGLSYGRDNGGGYLYFCSWSRTQNSRALSSQFPPLEESGGYRRPSPTYRE